MENTCCYGHVNYLEIRGSQNLTKLGQGCTAKSSDGVGEGRDLHHSRNWHLLKRLAMHDSVQLRCTMGSRCTLL